MKIRIEYLEKFAELHREARRQESLLSYMSSRESRLTLVREFSWSIPTPYAIKTILKLKMPIIEIGAGTGYWGSLIRDSGGDILCFDKNPPKTEKNSYNHKIEWMPVYEGDEETARLYPERALFLSWPPYSNPFASRCLDNYKGKYLIYIGEMEGGCTADDLFFDMLDRDWTQIDYVRLPRWDGLHDSLRIYSRKS